MFSLIQIKPAGSECRFEEFGRPRGIEARIVHMLGPDHCRARPGRDADALAKAKASLDVEGALGCLSRPRLVGCADDGGAVMRACFPVRGVQTHSGKYLQRDR